MAASQSVGRVERLLDRPRDPATTGHLIPCSLGPLADRLDLLTVGRYGCCLALGATLGRRRLRDLYRRGRVDKPRQLLPQLSGIGCSSKTPDYFVSPAHGFNAVHGAGLAKLLPPRPRIAASRLSAPASKNFGATASNRRALRTSSGRFCARKKSAAPWCRTLSRWAWRGS